VSPAGDPAPGVAPLPAAFGLRVTMLSDWHVGTGAGRPGSVDRLIARDVEGLPYIPAKTLTGILRDACERVAAALDAGERATWCSWLDYLFGNQPALAERPGASVPGAPEAPGEAHLRIRSARLPETLRGALRLRPHARAGLTFVKPGVRIDRRSGRAMDDHLRFEEMARGGVTLTAECSWTAPAEPQAALAATALLAAAARFVERIGGHRRRGSGRCRMTLDPIAEVEPYLAWIESGPPAPAAPRARAMAVAVRPGEVSGAAGEWFTLGLRLVAETPLVVPAATVGNVVECLDFVPGTYLLGEVTRRLGAGVLEPAVRGAIANGDLVVTHATLEVDAARGRPVPLSLSKRKLGGGLERGEGVYNLLVDERVSDGQLKPEGAVWVGATRAGVLPAARHVRRRLCTHNTVEDLSQRPSSEVGGVYSYQAIEAGTILRAELRLRGDLKRALDAARTEWWRGLAGGYAIGLAKKDDYGRVTVSVDAAPAGIPSKAASSAGALVVWLLSDALLDDERLRPARTPDALAAALGRRLGVTLRPRAGDTPASWAARDRRSEGWNRSWGLPRPTFAGLAAGTCGVFAIEGDPPDDFERRLAEVEAGGIGRRRAEGYGQIAFDDPLVTSALAGLTRAAQSEAPEAPATDDAPAGALVPAGAPEEAYARLVERALWRREIAVAASALAALPERRREVLGLTPDGGHSQPTLSQLAALRSAIGRLRATTDASSVEAWLEGVRAAKSRRDKWPRGALDAIAKLVGEAERVWAALDPSARLERLVITEAGPARLRAELWAEAVRTLVDACARAHKRAVEESARAAQPRPAVSAYGG
jgi:CRISPR-associated protein Csx10